MNHRVASAVVIVAGLTAVACQRAVPVEGPGMECVERLEIPGYPPIADSARISATATTAITIGPGGTLQSIAIEAGPPGEHGRPARQMPPALFSPTIERAIRTSKFSSACHGRTVHIVFDFVLTSRTNLPQGAEPVAFSYPNHFEIASGPRVIDTDTMKGP